MFLCVGVTALAVSMEFESRLDVCFKLDFTLNGDVCVLSSSLQKMIVMPDINKTILRCVIKDDIYIFSFDA